MPVALRVIAKGVAPLLPLLKYHSTPKRAGRVITKVLTESVHQTGVYQDENGHPMHASTQVRDPTYSDRYVAGTRALLATVPDGAS